VTITLIIATLALLLAGFSLLWRWVSRHGSFPCPVWLAWILEIPILDKWIGIQKSLDHMGLRAGQRILEIGPGAGRLLIPAAKRVLPGGED
jgi:small-conductance mechanosensitive channel